MGGRLTVAVTIAGAVFVLTLVSIVWCGVPYGGKCRVDGVQLLREWVTKCVPRSYSGVQKVVFVRGGMRSVWKWRVWHDAAGRSRMELIEPMLGRDSVIISDGKTTWHVIGGGKVVIQSQDVFRAPWEVNAERLDLLLQNYRVNALGKEEICKRECYIVSFEPHYNFNPSRKVWLDADAYIPLKVEDYNPDGTLAWQMEYEEFSIDERISPLLFQPSISKETKIINWGFSRKGPFRISELPTNLGFTPLLPASLPSGYTFDKAFVIELPGWQGKPVLHLIYTDGLNVISVFESKEAMLGEHPKPHKHGKPMQFFVPQSVVLRHVGNVRVVFISRISKSVLEQMAQSISAPVK
ncbi:MAG: sigma-E factor regulatory protein RseB domain-containing protein [Armatimonadota bacterium]|nr:outer membrane lipoprotein-sorting protein [Armatimonadota bacterium]MCX7776891.1 outer membrane lipoprotein-sorting protein [Armatimonadota bacterium]MDW8024423.1 sigma-E factor regulatory protein RseB domain-containing protein [Armatimonadota bacterium]